MWSKISNVLKPLTSSKEDSHTHNGASEVLNKVFEQHPNLSVFHHPNDSGFMGRQSVDGGHSPSVHSKRNMFKRLSKPLMHKDDPEELPALPPPSPVTHSRKTNNSLDFNSSQTSSTGDKPKPQRSSFDMLRPSPPHTNLMDTTRSVKDSQRRPSLDLLREGGDGSPRSLRINTSGTKKNNSIDIDFVSPAQDKGHSSVRSILRDRNSRPGTGQSVRFFSKNEFKVITPDNSAALSDVLLDKDKPQPPIPKDEEPFVDPVSDGSPTSLAKVSNSRPRPKLAGLFAPLDGEKPSDVNKENLSLSSPNTTSAAPPNEFSNLFDTSAHLELPSFPPSGLDFNVDAQTFGSSSFDMSVNDISYVVRDESLDGRGQMTSTPPKIDLKGKGKEVEAGVDDSLAVDEHEGNSDVPASAPAVLDDSIFHWKQRAKENKIKTPSPAHERSQSFSFGQTVFYSMMNRFGDSNAEEMEMEAAYPSSDVRGPSLDNLNPAGLPVPSPEGGSGKTRARAVSDTVFQDMLRISPKMALPEADINDESGADLVVYSGMATEPDPFSANANTYYTPQVNIPATPPKGAPKHLRTTSREENFIISLQTELALKTELCAQYEADLKARDELVEILGKKLGDVEKDDGKRKATVRGWKKKVQELERNCRMLEEAMDRSRQESVERSVMDEASGEALRMLHRQIQGLEGEKGEWVKREDKLKGEVEELEKVVTEQSEDLEGVKEKLRRGEERERELKEGLREAKEQIEMMGDCSVVINGVDVEELEREREQKETQETQKFRMKELELVQEVAEMKAKIEWVEVEKRGVEEQVEALTLQLRAKDEEWKVLKVEVEAQWERTEKMGEKVGELEREREELVAERDALRGDVESLEVQIDSLENEWREAEERLNELEEEVREISQAKDELEQERAKLEDCLQQERHTTNQLRADLHQTESRVGELEREKQFADERVVRLEGNLRNRDEEVDKYTRRFKTGEDEAERLREEISRFKREHERILKEQAHALSEAVRQKEMMERNLEEVIRSKVEGDLELKASKDREGRLVGEVEELKREVKTAKMDSADKEVRIVQVMKRAEREREDLVGLGIALESKQQELELIKRKLNVRGTGGSTPAPASNASRHRRDSSVFTATPLATSRPPSAMSSEDTSSVSVSGGAGVVEKSSNNLVSNLKVALGKSNRVNGTPLSSSVTKGSMGPPPAKSRPSINGMQTPTPTMGARAGLGVSRSSSASAFATPRTSVTSPTPTAGHRRGISANSEKETPAGKAKLAKSKSVAGGSPTAPGLVAEEDHEEKENVDLTNKISTSTRRRNLVPMLS